MPANVLNSSTELDDEAIAKCRMVFRIVMYSKVMGNYDFTDESKHGALKKIKVILPAHPMPIWIMMGILTWSSIAINEPAVIYRNNAPEKNYLQMTLPRRWLEYYRHWR